LCFDEQRKAAKEFILKNNIQEDGQNYWLTTSHLPNNYWDDLETKLNGNAAALKLATEELHG